MTNRPLFTCPYCETVNINGGFIKHADDCAGLMLQPGQCGLSVEKHGQRVALIQAIDAQGEVVTAAVHHLQPMDWPFSYSDTFPVTTETFTAAEFCAAFQQIAVEGLPVGAA